MSDRDELVKAIRSASRAGSAAYREACLAGIKPPDPHEIELDVLRSVFSERPHLANELLSGGHRVIQFLVGTEAEQEQDTPKSASHRSSVTGRYVSEEEAEANPRETVKERRER
jgi:hypothetical protein